MLSYDRSSVNLVLKGGSVRLLLAADIVLEGQAVTVSDVQRRVGTGVDLLTISVIFSIYFPCINSLLRVA